MSSELHETTPPTTREVRIVFAGLMLALALASLDQNIVGVALPQIVSELGGLHHLSWVVTSFLVTSTATTPLYGKLSDMYGRKPLFIIAIVIFLIGSCLCGLSRSMTELVVFRGIQGMGAGGLMVLAQTTIADLVAPRERGRYQGLFGAVFAFSSVAGPLLGGFITSALSWRWIFYVNVPVGIPALAMIAFGFHRPHHKVQHRIDYAAVALLSSATVALLLVLSWGGVQYPWSSPLIIGLAMASAVLTVLLIRTERRSAEPVLSPHIFHNRTVVIASSVMGLAFMGIFGAFVFLPLFFQLVMGMDAGEGRAHARAHDRRPDRDVLYRRPPRFPDRQVQDIPRRRPGLRLAFLYRRDVGGRVKRGHRRDRSGAHRPRRAASASSCPISSSLCKTRWEPASWARQRRPQRSSDSSAAPSAWPCPAPS